MNNLVIKNPEFKGIAIKVLTVYMISNLIMILYFTSIWRQLNKEIINRNIAVIGNVVRYNPELEDMIIGSFTQEIDNVYIKEGIQIAQKYGYTPKINLNISPTINKFYIKSIIVSSLILIGVLIVLLTFVYFTFKQFYGNVHHLSIGAEKIMEGNFKLKFPEENEGEISKLGFQFNQMSKRLQFTLEELRNEKDFLKNMISDISHQLKTPLTSLRMFNELLIEGAVEEPEVREEFLQKSFVQLDRMEWLIHTLLKMARLETGVIELNMEDKDIAKTIRDEIKSLKIRFNNKKQKVIMKNLDEAVYFPHDSRWIGEALRNIIKNSIDYTPEGGEISILMEETETLIRIEIEDTGMGISKEDIPLIFQRFYQGRNSKKVTKIGTGIGLSITKVIVEKHNGNIEVCSLEDKGTKFTIVFPKI